MHRLRSVGPCCRPVSRPVSLVQSPSPSLAPAPAPAPARQGCTGPLAASSRPRCPQPQPQPHLQPHLQPTWLDLLPPACVQGVTAMHRPAQTGSASPTGPADAPAAAGPAHTPAQQRRHRDPALRRLNRLILSQLAPARSSTPLATKTSHPWAAGCRRLAASATPAAAAAHIPAWQPRLPSSTQTRIHNCSQHRSISTSIAAAPSHWQQQDPHTLLKRLQDALHSKPSLAALKDAWISYLDLQRLHPHIPVATLVADSDRDRLLDLCRILATLARHRPQQHPVDSLVLECVAKLLADATSSIDARTQATALQTASRVLDRSLVVYLICERPLLAKSAYTRAVAAGVPVSLDALNVLVQVFSRARRHEEAAVFLDVFMDRTSADINSIVAWATADPEPVSASASGLQSRLVPDSRIVQAVLELCDQRCWIVPMEEFVDALCDRGFRFTPGHSLKIMRTYMRAGCHSRAIDVFEDVRLQQRWFAHSAGLRLNASHYTVAIKATLGLGRESAALRLADDMHEYLDTRDTLPQSKRQPSEHGSHPMQVVYGMFIDHYGTRNLAKAESLFRQMTAHGLEPNAVVRASMIKALVHHDRLDDALAMYKAHADAATIQLACDATDGSHVPDVPQIHVYTTLIARLIETKRFADVQTLLRDMRLFGHDDTSHVLVDACIRAIVQPSSNGRLVGSPLPHDQPVPAAADARDMGRTAQYLASDLVHEHLSQDPFDAVGVLTRLALTRPAADDLVTIISRVAVMYARAPLAHQSVVLVTATLTHLADSGLLRPDLPSRSQFAEHVRRLSSMVVAGSPAIVDASFFVAVVRCYGLLREPDDAMDAYAACRRLRMPLVPQLVSCVIWACVRGLRYADRRAVDLARLYLQDAMDGHGSAVDDASESGHGSASTSASAMVKRRKAGNGDRPSCDAHDSINGVVCAAYMYACTVARDVEAARLFWRGSWVSGSGCGRGDRWFDERYAARDGHGLVHQSTHGAGDYFAAYVRCLVRLVGRDATRHEVSQLLADAARVGAALSREAVVGLENAGLGVQWQPNGSVVVDGVVFGLVNRL
ncbi:hypothetical protein BC831DRAFT_190632 [Entophlyctis helioformis]|nr:hypothetical protein BC831DRAFT_190632 [Entophlyctis helioformis]